MVSKAHSVCPHFCPCMALIHAIRHADRLTNTSCLLAVAAFAVYVQKCVHPFVSKAHTVWPHFCPCMALIHAISPCRQAHKHFVFARCRGIRRIRPKMCPSVCEQGSHRLASFLSVHGSLLTRKMRRRKDLCRRRKKEKENKKKVRHGGLEPPTT